MIVYTLTKNDLKTFAISGHPFLSFDEFVNIVKWYRDYFYAAQNVRDFAATAGVEFNVWTRAIQCKYSRHVYLDQIKGDVNLSFEVPHLDRHSKFPLTVTMYDKDGVYFECELELALERCVDGRFVLSSWSRVPAIRDFLTSECSECQKSKTDWAPIL